MQCGARGLSACLVAAVAAVACSPALNWREVRPQGAALVAWFPCKPERLTRQIELAGARVAVEVLGCTADGSTWGLTSADVGEAARVGPALLQLRTARSTNLGGKELSSGPASVAGMTPSAGAVRLRIAGQRPDGQAVVEEALLFAVGTRVFHAAVLGGEPNAEALTGFFGNLKITRAAGP